MEGVTDKAAIAPLLDDEVTIICTHGTVSYEGLSRMGDEFEDEDVYILLDADDSGNQLRNRLKQVLPNACHLFTKRVYREVAHTPTEELARILHKAHFGLAAPWSDTVRWPELPRRRPPRRNK